MMFYVFIGTLHHRLIQGEKVMFSFALQVFLCPLRQLIETCCSNIYLDNPEGNGFLEIIICNSASAVEHKGNFRFFMDLL